MTNNHPDRYGTAVRAIYSDSNAAKDTQHIGLRHRAVDVIKCKQYGLRRAFINLQARDLPKMEQDLRNAIADVNTGLELSIPLIPLLLDYKVNLDLGGGLDLRQWWENLREKLLRGG